MWSAGTCFSFAPPSRKSRDLFLCTGHPLLNFQLIPPSLRSQGIGNQWHKWPLLDKLESGGPLRIRGRNCGPLLQYLFRLRLRSIRMGLFPSASWRDVRQSSGRCLNLMQSSPVVRAVGKVTQDDFDFVFQA